MDAGGTATTARRVAWELTHGKVAPAAQVLGCPGHPACVQVDDLSLDGDNRAKPGAGRSPRGSGSRTGPPAFRSAWSRGVRRKEVGEATR